MNKLLLIIATMALAQPALASSWNVSGLFDSIVPTANTTVATSNSNALPPMNTTYSTPGFNPDAQVTRVYRTQPTTSGGMPVCPNRNAVSQQSANGYQMNRVSRAY
ncbi:hypothetical protein ACUVZD_000209 [Pseudomonas aeruginosa]